MPTYYVFRPMSYFLRPTSHVLPPTFYVPLPTSYVSPSLITVEIILIVVTNFFWLLLVFRDDLFHSKEPALQHRSNKAIDKLITTFPIFENFHFLQSYRKTKSNQKKLVTIINIISTVIREGLV